MLVSGSVRSDDVCQCFVGATSRTFEEFCERQLVPDEAELARDAGHPFAISALIGFHGLATGAMALRLEEDLALSLTGHFFGTTPTAINADVIDCVGELANIIAGNATEVLESYQLVISVPTVVCGNGHTVDYPAGVSPQTVRFNTDGLAGSLEVVLALRQASTKPRISKRSIK